MILELTNFRCFSDLTLTLPDNGVILLHGTSGIGKSTIFKAISFVLFGKEQKIVKYNEKKCSVKLTYKNMIITRTKTPNHLTLLMNDEDKYEDDVAQEIINKKYGNYFNITSYIAQKSVDSFESLPIASKMDFFNRLALKDIDIKSIKDKCKDIIKTRKSLLNDKSNEIRILNNELSSFKLPEKIEIPFFLSKENLDEDIHQLKQNKNNCLDELSILQKKYNKLKLDFKKYQQNRDQSLTLETKILSLEQDIETNKKQIEILNEEVEEDKSDFIEELKLFSQYLTKLIEYNEMNTEFNSTKKDLLEKEEKKKLDIENKINHSFIKKETIDTFIKINNEKDKYKSILNLYQGNKIDFYFKIKDEINSLEQDILYIENELKDLDREYIEIQNTIKTINKVVKCPKCSTGLIINKNELEIYEKEKELSVLKDKEIKIKNEIEEKKKMKLEKSNHKSNLLKLEIKQEENKCIHLFKEYLLYFHENNLKKDINEIQDAFKEENSIQKSIEEIKDNSNLILKKLNTKCNDINLKKKKALDNCEKISDYFIEELINYSSFEWLKECDNEDVFEGSSPFNYQNLLEYDEVEILEMCNEVLTEIQKEETIKQEKIKRINEYKKKLDLQTKSLEKYKLELESIEVNDLNEIEEQLNEIEKNIEEKEKEKEEFVKKDEEMIIYLSYKNEIERFTKLEERIERCNEEEKEMIKSLNRGDKLLKLTTDAEALSITNTLNNINHQIRYYIDHFFPNGDLEMRLTPYKETLKGDKKSGLDIEITYNGEKITIDNLSGGEFDRCLLVLFLSFNNITNSDLILLDESLSSLNSELVEEIVDVLKTTLKDKLVLLTLHQANTGIFDYVLDIQKYR